MEERLIRLASIHSVLMALIFGPMFGFVLLGAKPAAALPVTFSKVADTDTAIPGGTGNFEDFGTPSIGGGEVAFRGRGSFPQQGVYTDVSGSLRVVADLNTAIPGGTGNFEDFGDPSIGGGEVAFRGLGSGSQQGIYTDVGGSLRVVADTDTAIPGGTGNFTFFTDTSIDGGEVAFSGASGDLSQQGVYTDVGGSLRVVADLNTAIPGGTGNFTLLDEPSIDGGDVAFSGQGSDFQEGVYTDVGGSLGVVADRNTAIPGGTGNFNRFSDPSIGGGDVAFGGRGSGSQEGIYTDVGGSLRVVADRNTAIPGGTGNFDIFTNPSIDGGDVAFSGFGFGSGSDFEGGLYVEVGGMLFEVIAAGDTLDGKTVEAVLSGEESLSGDQVAFFAGFTDGTEGVFIATIPEPSTAALMALGLVGLAARRRRR